MNLSIKVNMSCYTVKDMGSEMILINTSHYLVFDGMASNFSYNRFYLTVFSQSLFSDRQRDCEMLI